MEDSVKRVMASYDLLPLVERLEREEICAKVSQYLGKLSSVGHFDSEQLVFNGLEYLRNSS